MNVTELRKRHATFTYKSFSYTQIDNVLRVTFDFTISPNIEFHPHVSIPIASAVDETTISHLAFHLGMIEALSYWKSTCSPDFVIAAGRMNEAQIIWWQDLFLHGLGEFFYRNNIDFTGSGFLRFADRHDAVEYSSAKSHKGDGDLLLNGGGKDSAVMLETLPPREGGHTVLMVNPTPAATSMARIAGVRQPLVVKRQIDPTLLELNKSGYLNGHTPFSAYLSFISTTVCVLNGRSRVLVANESSAREGSVKFHDMDINHQYSKSYRYESRFREYCRDHLASTVDYLSFLRPLAELQIGALYSQLSVYDDVFSSCNVTRNDGWCGRCAKCAFVYLILRPFLPTERIRTIFGDTDYFTVGAIQNQIIELTGLGEQKPFDCVGTVEESRYALVLAEDAYRRQKLPVPEFVTQTLAKFPQPTTDAHQAREWVQTHWDGQNFLPDPLAQILRDAVRELSL